MKEKYDILDLTKYILSIMIVAIHTALYPMVLYPWLRLAVPLFFIISSYLLFLRVNSADEETKGKIIKKYILRNLLLYLLWFVILLPVTAYVRKSWFTGGFLHFVETGLPETLFSSTFIASWFITASVIAVIILYLTRKSNRVILGVILALVYALCCIRSSYYSEVESCTAVTKALSFYEKIFTNPVFSFPVATFWMFIGKCFAHVKDKKVAKIPAAAGVIVFSVLLYIEWKYVISLNGTYNNDCYFMLAPLSICIFALLKDVKITLKHSKLLRQISVVTFPLHASLIQVVKKLLEMTWGIKNSLITFLIVITVCHITTIVILRLEKLKLLSFLKYAH